ncbi:transporter substrate-binding domain-containing protein [Alsobacter sp. R-9]
MIRPELRRACLALWLCFLAFAGSGAFAQTNQAENKVFLPNFWETSQRLDRPDLTGLRSIRFLTDDDYPPMHFLTEDGKLAGFNVDLARAVCDVLNVACTIQSRRWDTLLDALKEGRGDAVVASMRATAQLRASNAVSRPYLRTPARFIGRTGGAAPLSPDDAAGRTVGVVAGSAHENYLRTFFASAAIRPFETLDLALAALRNGEVEFLFGDGLTLAIWLNGTDGARCCVFAGGPYTESRWFGEGVVIVMRPNEPTLRRAVDYALQRLAETGKHAELYLRYFPVGFY